MNKKKMICLLMAATLAVGTMAGCGSNAEGTEEKADSTATASSGETAEAKEITLPLTDEPVTLKVWLPAVSIVLTTWGDYNSVPFFQEMEKRTGVHLEFETPVEGEETTAFNLMISSGELPDIICWPNYYSDGYDAAIDDGYYLDLTPYLNTYLSNYNALRQTDERWMMDSTTDGGKVATVMGLMTEPQGAWGGLQIRQDWLDDLGLETPVTYDDLENVLTAFKEQKGAYAPLALCSKGNYYYGEMSGGFGVTDDFMNVDGTVKCGFIQDEWRDYLKLMNDWYEKGLIDPDFMTNSSWMVDTELVTSGASGVWWSMYTMPATYEASDSSMKVKALASPKLNADDTVHFRMADSYDNRGIAISADCEHKEIAMQWIDYLFTKEGAALANYGPEGLTFEYDDNGDVKLTDFTLNNEDGMSPGSVITAYGLIPDKIPSHYDWTRELLYTPEEEVESYSIWADDSHLDDWVMPAYMSMTQEESKEYASLYTDIQTYYREASCQFITGVLDIDGTDWDAYLNVIDGMGIDRCVELKQAALDRYLER